MSVFDPAVTCVSSKTNRPVPSGEVRPTDSQLLSTVRRYAIAVTMCPSAENQVSRTRPGSACALTRESSVGVVKSPIAAMPRCGRAPMLVKPPPA